jgi:hypothetical protein
MKIAKSGFGFSEAFKSGIGFGFGFYTFYLII